MSGTAGDADLLKALRQLELVTRDLEAETLYLTRTRVFTQQAVREASDLVVPMLSHEDPAVRRMAHDVLNTLDKPLALVLRLQTRLSKHTVAMQAARAAGEEITRLTTAATEEV